MKTEDIKKMGDAYWKVLQAIEEKKKLDPVDQDELKGDHEDRKDKDIDNDGDADSTDKYLHSRRKAISKAMKKEEVEQTSKMTRPVEAIRRALYKMVDEAMDKHRKGATPPEAIDSKASQGEKDFVAQHGGLDGNDSGISGDKAAADTIANADGGVKKATARRGDNPQSDKIQMPKDTTKG